MPQLGYATGFVFHFQPRYKDVIVTAESPAAENVLLVFQPMTSMGVAYLDSLCRLLAIAMQNEW